MLFLGLYVWFVDAPPSLVRAYAMVLVGWSAVLLGLELLSFTLLGAVFLSLLVLFPSLLVSLSFWLSVAGVYYIFLLLTYTQTWHKSIISLFFIPVGIFVLMLPIVHGIFGMTSSYQLLSPLLSLLFIPFYPLVMVLHLVGMGGIFDEMLLKLFALPKEGSEHFLPLWMVAVYVSVSLLAMWYRVIFYGVVGVSVGYAVYLFV